MYVFTAIYLPLHLKGGILMYWYCLKCIYGWKYKFVEILVFIHKHSNPFKPFIIIIEQLQLHDMCLIVILFAMTKVLLCHHVVTLQNHGAPDLLLVPLGSPWGGNLNFCHFTIFEPMERKLLNWEWFPSLEIN